MTGRTALVSLAGLTLAVVAESCSVGLVGLAGWFIASSAVAGAGTYSAFSYLGPSGGVRAFALGRIGANYASRVVLHSAALRRISAARLKFYDRAAASPSDGTWSGQSLDRVMADADTRGMALIQATAPMVVTLALTAGGFVVIAVAGYPRTAVIVAVAVAVCAVLAIAGVRRADDVSQARGTLRAELVTAVEAWTEMASLGAADRLADRTLRRLATFEDRRLSQAATQARIAGMARTVTAATLLLVVVSAARSGADVSTLVFVALLAAGGLGNAERLGAAVQARLVSRQAGERLDSADRPVRPASVRAAYDHCGLTVSGHRLPETSTRTARQIEFRVATGQTLVVTGESGSGKTTLLNAIEAALRPGPTTVAAVLADDYLFSGSAADNIRLANPAVDDSEIAELFAGMLLDRTGVEPDTPIGAAGRDLSGGEQRRLHIARAVATHPDVLLIDEPTTGLDTDLGAHVLTAIRRLLPHAVLVLAMHEVPVDAAWMTVSLD
jgi:ATP-binding cassette subfamily C protein CydC